MKKISICIILIVSLLLVMAPAALAAEPYVLDNAQLLSSAEKNKLEDRAIGISGQYDCDVRIVTVEEITKGYSVQEFSKSFYNDLDFGSGANRSCILLFLSIGERDFDLRAWGYANTAFTNHGKDVMLDKHILPLLKEDNYFAAFSAYLDKSEEFLSLARAGKPFDVGSESNFWTNLLTKLGITILIPLFIAQLICSLLKSQMKTAVSAKAADQYIPPGGFTLTRQDDIFLYRTETRTKIQSNNSSRSGGGTTVRGGSSGRSGKF